MLAPLLLAASLHQALTFEQIEQKKYEAFSQLEGMSGSYLIVVQTSTGSRRQKAKFWVSQEGRRLKIIVDDKALAEQGITKDQKWTVLHNSKSYSLVQREKDTPIVEKYEPLKAQDGRLNMSVTDYGPRFATDPPPTIVKTEEVKEEGKAMTRIEAVAKNAANQGMVKIVQLFDKGSYICQVFSVEVTINGKTVMQVNGLLQDQKKAPIAKDFFSFSPALASGYTKVGG